MNRSFSLTTAVTGLCVRRPLLYYNTLHAFAKKREERGKEKEKRRDRQRDRQRDRKSETETGLLEQPPPPTGRRLLSLRSVFAYNMCSVSLRHDLIFRARYYMGPKTRTKQGVDSRPNGYR